LQIDGHFRPVAALVDEAAVDRHRGDVGGILERITVVEYEIGDFTGFECAESVVDLQDLSGVERNGP
jgi:hypothetical protein